MELSFIEFTYFINSCRRLVSRMGLRDPVISRFDSRSSLNRGLTSEPRTAIRSKLRLLQSFFNNVLPSRMKSSSAVDLAVPRVGFSLISRNNELEESN